MNAEAQRFAPAGEPLALEPGAFGFFFAEPYVPAVLNRDGVVVLGVRGVLKQHHVPGAECDSYDWICARVAGALATPPRAIVLSISSPGGVVSGVFEAAERIRQLCADAGVPLFAYVDGLTCSAAYALACAADRIVAPPTASVGSIGVIAECVDAHRQLEQMGVDVSLVTSGTTKGDGDPRVKAGQPAPALARVQEKVLALAEHFFAFVASRRPLSVDAVRALDARVVLGQEAKALGLVDDVQTLETLLTTVAAAAAPEVQTMTANVNASQGEDDEDQEYEDAVAVLRKRAAAGDARAKRMLTAELAEDDPPEDEDDDKPEDGKGAGAPAQASVSASTTGEIASRLSTVERRLEAQERSEILAARPDLSPSLVKVLSTKPVAEVRAIVDAIEKPKKPTLAEKAATAVVGGTRGDGTDTGDRADRQTPEAAARMDAAMGRTALKPTVRREGTTLYLGALTSESKPIA